MRTNYFLFFFVITLLVKVNSTAQSKNAQIIVGKNVQVSKDGNFTHAEMMLAANPVDPDNLILGSSTMPAKNNNRMDKIYITKDGGSTWEDISLPEEVKYGGGDPQVAFDLYGNALFVSMVHQQSMIEGYSSISAYCYKSMDGGSTWGKPVDFAGNPQYGFPRGIDHEMIAVDHSFGKYAGRIYINAMIGNSLKKGALWLYRSEDGGKSFIGPSAVIEGEAKVGPPQTGNLMISSKGDLFYTYIRGSKDHVLALKFGDSTNIFFIKSKDGGITFSSPQIAAIQDKYCFSHEYSFPHLAIDNKSEKYLDRLYCAFTNFQNGKSRLFFTYSKDEGENWSKPQLVDIQTPEDAIQYNPSVAVNPQGVVGIRWYDTRGQEKGEGFNEYFTASIDGGETFLAPVRVSSITSKVPDDNTIVTPRWQRSINKDSLIVSFDNNLWYEFGSKGGDYNIFTADARGVFHDVWTDSRDGKSFQIFTSAIKVVQNETNKWDLYNKQRTDGEIKEKKLTPIKGNKKFSQISKYTSLVFDQVDYDSTTKILSIPVRLKNTSDKTIYGPIQLTIDKIDTTVKYGMYGKGDYKNTIPVIVNSNNKKKGAGAQFVFSSVNSGALLPDEETTTVTWKFQVKIPKEVIPGSKLSVEQKENLNEETIKGVERDRVIWFSKAIAELHISVTGYVQE